MHFFLFFFKILYLINIQCFIFIIRLFRILFFSKFSIFTAENGGNFRRIFALVRKNRKNV